MLDESNRKPNKLWVNKGREFYNISMRSLLGRNSIEMYSIHKEGKSVAAEKFIRTLNNKIYKYMIWITKNLYVYKLDDIVNKYNNTYRTIKTKPVDIKPSMYIDFNKRSNKEDPKFKVGDNVRISNINILLNQIYLIM